MAATPADLAAALVPGPETLTDWLVVLPVVWCLLSAAVLAALRRFTRLQGRAAIAALCLLVGLDAALVVRIAAEGPITMVMGRWLPPFGIAFTADMAGALLALVCALVALAVAVFALVEVGESERRYGFFPFLMMLMAGVTGAFLTGDVFNLYVWFEVLLISSFGLLALGSTPVRLDGTLKYGFLNLIATTLFLIAIGLLYATLGTLNMADIARRADVTAQTTPMVTIAALFTFAFAMKAAAFPLHFWLPAAYHTPRFAVSALFAAILTKVGIYALLRVLVMMLPAQAESLSFAIALMAAATMAIGAFGALAAPDLKRQLGYVVISGIGAMLAGIAVGGPGGIGGALFYALHSILVMAALYLLAGIAGSLFAEGASWRGLWTSHPLLGALALALFFSVSGLPPFSGFWPKVMLVKAALDIGAWWLAATLLLSGFLTMIALFRHVLLAWWRMPEDGARPVSAARLPHRTLWPLAALTAASLAVGLYPEPVLSTVQGAAAGLIDPAAYIASVFPGGTP